MSDKLDIDSEGRLVGDADQQARLDAIKARQAADKAAAAAKKKAAEKASSAAKETADKAEEAAKEDTATAKKASSSITGSEVGKEVLEIGGAALTSAVTAATKGGSRKGGGSRIVPIVIIVVVLIAAIVLWPKIAFKLGLGSDTQPEETLTSGVTTTQIDFNDAVLKESRQVQQLIVFEQKVQVDTGLSSEFAGLAIFRKTQTIHTYGVGSYTVDLSQITDDSTTVDDTAKTVTVRIPRTHLRYIYVDPNQTTFEDTDHALLAFGDLKLSEEQHNAIEKSIQEAMREQLTATDTYAAADEAAKLEVYDTYQPIIADLSDEYTLDIEFADGSANADDSPDVTDFSGSVGQSAGETTS